MDYRVDQQACGEFEKSSRTEWILTNGIGGYAMGTVSGASTRKYHGHLVAAGVPAGSRTVLLANYECFIQTDGQPEGLCTNQYVGAVHPKGYKHLVEFACGDSCLWRYEALGARLEKEHILHQGVNACTTLFRNTGDRPFKLILRPLVAHKGYHDNFHESHGYPESLRFPEQQTVVDHGGTALFLHHPGAQRIPVEGWYYRFQYMRDAERGLPDTGDLFCPCELSYEIFPGEEIHIVASDYGETNPMGPFDEPVAESTGQKLRKSARHYIVEMGGRKSIIAGYPWFTDWGRDSMISLPGLCLTTGDVSTARSIILAYASHMKRGIIPNRFVESGQEPEYNTVDASLWMANAMYETLKAEWDLDFATRCMTALEALFHWHVQGTLNGIKVDPVDGLLTQGASGVQLTWMDAKVGDWVVTPRHGKPVEINALWINTLRILGWLSKELERPNQVYQDAAQKAEDHFEEKFWRQSLGYYLDTADPDDASLRPNQVLGMALPFSPMNRAHAKLALDKVRSKLLTPYGLRTLSPDDPNYVGRFEGSMEKRDAAYHQGTVWPWLLGPYCRASIRLEGTKDEAREILKGAGRMLEESGLGGIAEVYDGDAPHRPSGCPWQAWSVGEILRAMDETDGVEPLAKPVEETPAVQPPETSEPTPMPAPLTSEEAELLIARQVPPQASS
jgi:predicted glycogen debranching enzyme